MIIIEPQIPDNARYPIGMAAQVLGLNRCTLRKKTKEGLIKCGHRRMGKKIETCRKFYIGAEIKRFWRSQL